MLHHQIVVLLYQISPLFWQKYVKGMNRCYNEQRTVNSFFRDVLVAKVLKSATHKKQVPDSLQEKNQRTNLAIRDEEFSTSSLTI